MQQQTNVLDIAPERIGEPAHVVAHWFGGLASLAHTIHGKIKAASLSLIEANPFGILRTAEEKEPYEYFERIASAKYDKREGDSDGTVIVKKIKPRRRMTGPSRRSAGR